MAEENTVNQNKKQNYDWLKGYQYVKGQSGNPNGRPKGSKSLKVFAREYLESLPEDEKIEFLKSLPEEIVWKMAEGNPRNDDKLEIDIPKNLIDLIKDVKPDGDTNIPKEDTK